jgi:uncharacterized membrane protein
MNQKREPRFDRTVALALRIGAFAGFGVMLVAVLARIFLHNALPGRIATAGVLVMLVTPLVRVFVVLILFLREKDWKYSAVAFGVLLILLVGAVTGIGER